MFLTKKSLSSDENFRIFIPKEVESKFRTLCELSPELEWSGVLFYTIMGSFEDKNLEVHCKDFFLMDQGTKVNTEINYNTPEIAAYMAQNIELLDCYQGLCHSHNTMPTFFSGTDDEALKQEGMNMNNFVSLIVNNAGQYTAAITRKVITDIQQDMTITKEGYYTFFAEDKHISTGKTTTRKQINNQWFEIESFPLTIVKEEVPENETAKRFWDVIIRQRKLQQTKVVQSPSIKTFDNGSYWAGKGTKNTKEKGTKLPAISFTEKQATLFPELDEEEIYPFEQGRMTIKDVEEDLPGIQEEDDEESAGMEDYEFIASEINWSDESVTHIEQLLRQLVLGTPIVAKKTSIKDIAAKLEKLYSDRFDDSEEPHFLEWIRSYAEWLVWEYNTEWMLDQYEGLDEEERVCITAYKLIDMLSKFPDGDFCMAIINAVSNLTF